MIEIIAQGMGDYNFPHLIWHLTIIFYLIILTGLFSVADTVSGVYTARRLGEKLRSHRYRKTVEKITWYWFFQLLVAAVGLIGTLFPWYSLPYLSIMAAVGICGIEGKSIWEHTQRRRDRMSKLPEILKEAMELVGDVDDVRSALKSAAKTKITNIIADEKD